MRFVSMFEQPATGDLKATDRWILSELNELVRVSREGYEDYNFFVPANRCREFLWNVFAPHYLEMVKGRAYEGDTGARFTLNEVMKTLLRILAPITAFSTDKMWREVYGGSVHDQAMPEARTDWENDLRRLTQGLIEFNSKVWKDKKDRGLSLNEPLQGVTIPENLKPFEADLVRMHKIG
jgi:valyl-tRNA synthetase